MTKSSFTQNEPQKLSRREALKALAAAGGALSAAAFLPARWAKPLVEAGVLPAHAQGSVTCAPPYTFAACPAGTAAWTWSPENQQFYLGFTAEAVITPACPGVSLCFRIQTRNGDQVVFDVAGGCFPTNADGALSVVGQVVASNVGDANLVGLVISMADNPDETCEAFTTIPQRPGLPDGAKPGGSAKAGPPFTIKVKHQ